MGSSNPQPSKPYSFSACAVCIYVSISYIYSIKALFGLSRTLTCRHTEKQYSRIRINKLGQTLVIYRFRI